MSKNKQRLWLFFMLLIYLSIAIVGFIIAYFIKTTLLTSKKTAIKPLSTINKVISIPTPVGWKTYTSTIYKLHFSYPTEDNINSSTIGFGVTSIEMRNASNNLDFQILLLPKSLAHVVGQDFDNYYAMPNRVTRVIQSPLAKDNTTEKFTKIHNRSIDSNKAIDYQSIASNAKPNSQPEIGTYIQVGNNVVLFSTETSNKKKLEQLLSTFIYTP